MSATDNGGAPPEFPIDKAELEALLREALDREPGLCKKVVQEALARQEEIEKASGKAGEQSSSTPTASSESPQTLPQRKFKAEVRQQAIPLPDAATAQQLRNHLNQYTGEAIAFEGDHVVLVRTFAFAVEETPDVAEKKDGSCANESNVAPVDGKPVADNAAEPTVPGPVPEPKPDGQQENDPTD